MAAHKQTLGSVRVLVIEDNTGMREILWSILTGFGCTKLTCSETVEGALEALPTLSPDLALVDYQLRNETGLAFLHAVRASKDPLISTLPLIMITAHTQLARVREFINAGADEILAKPVRADALYRRIAAVVNERRPFVETDIYFGPDRRRRPSHYDKEKRTPDDDGDQSDEGSSGYVDVG